MPWTGCPWRACPRATRTGAPSTTTSPAGPPTAPWGGCMRCFEVQRAWPPAARWHRCRGHRLPVGARQRLGLTRQQGYDAAKKVHGRKRHLATDTCGLPLDILVTPPASRTATVAAGCCGACAATCRRSGWCGPMPATPASWSLGGPGPHPDPGDPPQTPRRPPLPGPAPQVGRGTHLLLVGKCRRLAVDYERKPEHHQAWEQWAMVRVMVKRPARQAPPLPSRTLSLAA